MVHFPAVLGRAVPALFTAWILAIATPSTARPLTVADDVEFSYFGDPWRGKAEAITYSPNGHYFIVATARGRIDLNRPETTLRVYSTKDVHRFLTREDVSRDVAPVWTLKRSRSAVGPSIQNIQWLRNSTGFTFLAKNAKGNDQLFLADLKTRTLQKLSAETQQVEGFDVRSRRSAVYSVRNPAIMQQAILRSNAVVDIGTGTGFYDLVFPLDPTRLRAGLNDQSELWAIVKGKRFRVQAKSTEKAVYVYRNGARALAMSPDGSVILTALPLREVPREWETLYLPAQPTWPFRIKAGPQDVESFSGLERVVEEYALVNLISGEVTSLTGAPTAKASGWRAEPGGTFSEDGRYVALFDSYLSAAAYGQSRPPYPACVVIVDLVTRKSTCLQQLKGSGPGSRYVWRVRFVTTTAGARVAVDYLLPSSETDRASVIYASSASGSWSLVEHANSASTEERTFDVKVQQDLNTPPVLVATDRGTHKTKVLLDPNPQFEGIDLGSVSALNLKDKDGHEFVAGLYKPTHFVVGQRYPLVVQTHGFAEDQFSLAGAYPTAFAAQELAGAGIMVLQMHERECEAHLNTPEEGRCNVAQYEAAVKKLVSDGLVDPMHLGIIGFSRSCYYVLEALTTSSLRFSAASITDGVNYGYLQFLMQVDTLGNAVPRESVGIVGGPPFGSELPKWLKRSPEFNLDKISAALQVVAAGPHGIPFMWEPYAALRYLNKPVDLVVLHTYEHVFTNPAVRLASQGGSVDWFRFWLQDYEDPDSAKAAQYARWRELRKLQDTEKIRTDATPLNSAVTP